MTVSPAPISPVDLGLPPKFSSWRPAQWDMLTRAYDSESRFVGVSASTGMGKSLVYMALAKLSGRACVLTSTKALQRQLLNDFRSMGLAEIKGQGNYECVVTAPESGLKPWQRMCDWGPCHTGYPCGHKESGCTYFDAYRTAKGSELVVTNYAYWLSIHKYGGGLGEFELLICDEAHAVPEELCGFLAQEFKPEDLDRLRTPPEDEDDLDGWRKWAARELDRVQGELDALKKSKGRGDRRDARELRMLAQKLSVISTMRGQWAIQRKGKRVLCDPVWPAGYREMLFQGIPKVVLVSATVRPKTCEMLGIPGKDLDFQEHPAAFPAWRRPVIHVPTVRVDSRATRNQMRYWVDRIDQIIDRRTDRKGIVHTTSYARRNFLLEHSRHRGVMLTHDTRSAARIVEKFKRARPPCVLVSPAMTTGYDFPGDEARYNVIGKIPFPDTRSKLMRLRAEKDKEYAAYLAMQTLVQTAGRIVRSADDFGETLIVDDHAEWFPYKHRDFAPPWFMESFQRASNVPEAPDLKKILKRG